MTTSSRVLATTVRIAGSPMPDTAALAAISVSHSVANSGAVVAALVLVEAIGGASSFLTVQSDI